MCESIKYHVKQMTTEEHSIIVKWRYQMSVFTHRNPCLKKSIPVGRLESQVWLLYYFNLNTSDTKVRR